jgi:hypothetical protein
MTMGTISIPVYCRASFSLQNAFFDVPVNCMPLQIKQYECWYFMTDASDNLKLSNGSPDVRLTEPWF